MTDKLDPAGSLVDLFEYARAMEVETARRYDVLADTMIQHNNQDLAELFKRMAEIEWMHVYRVGEIRRESGVGERSGPSSPGLGLDAAEVPDLSEIHYLHRPYHALELARRFEERAARFYTELAAVAQNEDVRTMALQFAAEEEMHVRELQRWLSRYPVPEAGWDEDPDPPNELE